MMDITLEELDTAIKLMLRCDGDRDHMNSSYLNVEQSMAICIFLQRVRHQLYPEALR